MIPAYDAQNVFARILRGEIPCKKLHETEHSLAFPDISPQAPTHVLVIPKGAYVSYEDFALRASDAEILDFTRALAEVCRITGAGEEGGGSGFRAITNAGVVSGQEVPHMHVHILSGRPLGRLVERAG